MKYTLQAGGCGENLLCLLSNQDPYLPVLEQWGRVIQFQLLQLPVGSDLRSVAMSLAMENHEDILTGLHIGPTDGLRLDLRLFLQLSSAQELQSQLE